MRMCKLVCNWYKWAISTKNYLFLLFLFLQYLYYIWIWSPSGNHAMVSDSPSFPSSIWDLVNFCLARHPSTAEVQPSFFHPPSGNLKRYVSVVRYRLYTRRFPTSATSVIWFFTRSSLSISGTVRNWPVSSIPHRSNRKENFSMVRDSDPYIGIGIGSDRVL